MLSAVVVVVVDAHFPHTTFYRKQEHGRLWEALSIAKHVRAAVVSFFPRTDQTEGQFRFSCTRLFTTVD